MARKRKTVKYAGKEFEKYGKAYVRKGKGKMSNRHCVIVDTGKRAPGFKGKGSTKRFMGCFVDARDAQSAAKKAERMAARGRR